MTAQIKERNHANSSPATPIAHCTIKVRGKLSNSFSGEMAEPQVDQKGNEPERRGIEKGKKVNDIIKSTGGVR